MVLSSSSTVYIPITLVCTALLGNYKCDTGMEVDLSQCMNVLELKPLFWLSLEEQIDIIYQVCHIQSATGINQSIWDWIPCQFLAMHVTCIPMRWEKKHLNNWGWCVSGIILFPFYWAKNSRETKVKACEEWITYRKTHSNFLLEGSKAELTLRSTSWSSLRFSWSSRCFCKISRILWRLLLEPEVLLGDLVTSSKARLEAMSAAKRIASASSLRSWKIKN